MVKKIEPTCNRLNTPDRWFAKPYLGSFSDTVSSSYGTCSTSQLISSSSKSSTASRGVVSAVSIIIAMYQKLQLVETD